MVQHVPREAETRERRDQIMPGPSVTEVAAGSAVTLRRAVFAMAETAVLGNLPAI